MQKESSVSQSINTDTEKEVPKFKQLDTSKKGNDISLSNNEHTINVTKAGARSILCKETIPLKGTHSFTALHSTPKEHAAHIGIASKSINLNNHL